MMTETQHTRDYLAGQGITILERSGCVAVCEDHGTLVICEIQVRERRSASRLALAKTTVKSYRRSAVAWMHAHGRSYERVRVDLLRVTRDGPGGYTAEYARGVG